MNFEMLAFYTGLLGSLHCVTMCGPLMLLPFSGKSVGAVVLQKVLYQLGRIMMYGVLGLIVGLIGSGFNFLGLQQIVSLITGTLLLVAGINYFVNKKQQHWNLFTAKLLSPMTNLLGKSLAKPYGGFVAGVLNGLLPCGLTYIALAQAVNLHTVAESGRFMIFFGLGTVPLLLLTAIAPLLFKKLKVPAVLIPMLFLVAGGFLIFRGLNVSTPSVAHGQTTKTAPMCH